MTITACPGVEENIFTRVTSQMMYGWDARISKHIVWIPVSRLEELASNHNIFFLKFGVHLSKPYHI
jgi:hypothetical protein